MRNHTITAQQHACPTEARRDVAVKLRHRVQMSKAKAILTIIAIMLGVGLLDIVSKSRVPQFEKDPLGRSVDLIIAQPRLHRDLIAKCGDPLTPLLVKKLQEWRSPEKPLYRDLYAKLHHGSPAALRQFLPEPMSKEQRCLNVIRALAYLGPAAAGATRTLIPFLSDERFAPDAAHALASIGADAREAVPRLAAALDDQVPWAATALGNMGLAAVHAIPDLDRAGTNAIVEGPGWFRREVEKAIEKIRAAERIRCRVHGAGERTD